MTNIKNNIKNRTTITHLTLLILLCAVIINLEAFAQTPIAVQESRLDSLSDLSYQIKVSKSRVELAKLKKQCLENKGCEADNNNPVDAISSAVKPISTRSEHNNNHTEALVNKTPKPIQTNLIKKLNRLSISAIINNRVVFKDIEGSFKQGDALGDSGIKIISITQSNVVLGTANNIKKTIIMDWIDD